MVPPVHVLSVEKESLKEKCKALISSSISKCEEMIMRKNPLMK